MQGDYLVEGKKILIVDDEKNLQEMVSDILTAANFQTITADDGLEGLQKIYSESPDLILLDCEMPRLDGYELLAKMRADPLMVNKPVIMLTVRNSENDEIKGLRLGIDDYITKPFKPSVLLARIKTVLERKAMSLGANPLTMLAGNVTITVEIEKRIAAKDDFAVLYVDINNFKSFNDKYGFPRGDKIIKHVASVLTRAVRETGNSSAFVGHIGGDDFIVIVGNDKYIKIAERIIQLFDETIGDFYDIEDKVKGFIVTEDRQHNIREFPIMGVSIAIVTTLHTKLTHYAQLGEITAGLKKLAKQYTRSAYVVERRKE